MKLEITKLPKSEIELNIEVPVEDWNVFLNEAAKDFSKEIKIEGFRPGFAPFNLVEEKVGIDRILEKAADNCLKKYYVKALLENNIEAIGKPEFLILKMAKGNPFQFKAKVAVLPQVKLPDYQKIASQFKRRKVFIQEKEVEEALIWLQKSRAKFILKQEPSEKGDWVEIEYSCPEIENGRKIEDAFILGQGNFLPGFEENFINMKEGQEKEFTLAFPKDHKISYLAGRDVNFKVKLKSVKKIEFPEINDQFAQSLGNFADLASLKESIKEGIILEKQKEESRRLHQEIIEKIAKSSELEIPVILIEREKKIIWEEFKENVSQKLGLKMEEYFVKVKKDEKYFDELFSKEAEKRVKNNLILREIFKKENLKISDQEIEAETRKLLVYYPTLKELDLNQLKGYTEEVLKNEKVFQFLESFVQEI